MREKQESGSVPVPAEFMSAQSAIVGLRGKDLLTTVRSLAVHGLRQPLHSARHLVAFGGQLGKVLLGDTLHQPNPQDARFQDPSWRLNPFYRRTLQAYLAWQKQLLAWIDESNLDCDDRARARFLVALLSDAVAPSNSLINPLAVKELFNTGGISLLNGVRHLLEDLVHNGGMPSQVNKTAFEIGRNLATTQGAVVFRNEVLELIQYKPLGERQYAKPLLIVPPQINKYYIFDLSPEKSFVQYALKNNLQVFVISWRNPDAQHREWGLSTYVEALDQAIEVSREITGSRSVNLAGACAGGLTVAALLGHLQVRRQLRKVSSVTYLVSLLDSQMESPAMLFADEQVVVDPVVPDQVVGAHPGEHLGHVLALQHAGLVGTTLGGLQSLLVGEQRDLGIQFEVEHADQLGEGVDLLLAAGHVVADQGRGGDPAGAGAEEVEVLAAGDRQDYLDGLLERLDIGGQAPFALRLGRVAPTDDEGLHAVAQAEARQALVRRQVEDVELVDLRRHHQQRAFVHRLGDRPVLDQFQHVVAEHHGALGGGQVLAHLEGVHVHLARHPAVVHQVLGQVAEAVQQALAAGLEEALDRRRVAQAVGRRHRLGQQVDDELATTDVLRRQVAVADPAVQLLAPGQVGLHVALVQRILAPGRIGKASVVIAWA